jgi:hypothetical protein
MLALILIDVSVNLKTIGEGIEPEAEYVWKGSKAVVNAYLDLRQLCPQHRT